MGLVRFILGVLGILLIIGAFTSFIPLLFLGGIATGSVAFAFGFPIFLMILGAAIVYYGFYYKESVRKSNIQLGQVAKWGIIHSIAILLANYVTSRFIILDNFLVILFTAIIVSIVTQVVRSHESHFNLKWFIFYFLVYANVIWVIGEFILPKLFFQTTTFSSFFVGFILAGVVDIIQKINIRQHAIQWISIVLVITMLVSNLGSVMSLVNLESLPIDTTKIKQTKNTSELSEKDQVCPTPDLPRLPLLKAQSALESELIAGTINDLVDTSVWRIEGNVRNCYKGKYKGQYPDWFYCDDMIVSRWETTSSGTISYRWYTAVTAEWRPEDGKYVFDDFSCENGKKVTVDKETTAYYVHVSRDGTEIKIEY